MQLIKYLLIACIVILTLNKSYSCDSCGGNIGSTFNGLFSLRNSSFCSLKWDYNSYISSKSSSHNIQDNFHSLQLSARYRMKNNWSVQAFVPFLSKSRIENSTQSTFTGFGDAIASLNYTLSSGLPSNIRKSAEFGLGFKLPIGKYKSSLHDINLPQNFNLGTGSLGYFISGNFAMNTEKYGIAIYSAYILELTSPDGYKFGNSTSNNLSIFRKFSMAPKLTLKGSIGLNYERQEKERYANGNQVISSGSEALLIPFSIGFNHQKWMVQAKYSSPIYQNFTNNELIIKSRLNLQFTYFIN